MVDDEPDLDLLIQQRFRRQIQAGEFSFTFARNGKTALEFLEAHPDIQLIITDLNMPEMNGIELLLQIKKRYDDKRVIVISAYSDRDSIQTAKNAGASDFLCKPINLAEFEQKIRENLDALSAGQASA
jgi:CheY-like chemotaxis protein